MPRSSGGRSDRPGARSGAGPRPVPWGPVPEVRGAWHQSSGVMNPSLEESELEQRQQQGDEEQGDREHCGAPRVLVIVQLGDDEVGEYVRLVLRTAPGQQVDLSKRLEG